MNLSDCMFLFLKDSVFLDKDRVNQNFYSKNFYSCISYLKENFGLIPLPVAETKKLSNFYPLWIAEHTKYGTLLVREGRGIKGKQKILEINSGKILNLTEKLEGELFNKHILFPTFPNTRNINGKNLRSFIFQPLKRLNYLLIFLQTLEMTCGSLFFIINFSILAYVVPSQNLESFWSLGYLIIVVLLTVLMTKVIKERVKLNLNSQIEERVELLKISLFHSIRPKYISREGREKTKELCLLVAQSGMAQNELTLSLITTLALIPIIILLYMRLPTSLFIISLLLAILSMLPKIILQPYLTVKDKKLTDVKMEANKSLHYLFIHFKKLEFFNSTSAFRSEWKTKENEANELELDLFSKNTIIGETEMCFRDFTQIVTILILTITVASYVKQDMDLSISSAFIMFHLVLQTYTMVPKVNNILTTHMQIRKDLFSAKGLLLEIKKFHNLEKNSSVTDIEPSIESHHLKLACSCIINGAEDLTINLKGKHVVCVTGESGAGKTTLLQTILGLTRPHNGTIKIFGVNPSLMNSTERNRIFSYADQNMKLLPGTIRDNLSAFCSRQDLGSEQDIDRKIWHILKWVEISDQVQELNLGLDTPISTSSQSFSTSELQRLALAQCLMKRSAIIVIDEAMSSLSSEMEERILSRIIQSFDQVYFTSHRASMHKFADTIINIEKTS